VFVVIFFEGPASNGRLDVMGGFMIFNWTVDMASKEIRVIVKARHFRRNVFFFFFANVLTGSFQQARTSGWIGVGFALTEDSGMLGADAIIGYVDDTDGTAHVRRVECSSTSLR
jgi:hypothetical protein